MQRIALIFVTLVLLVAPLGADDVHLKNGRVFEDVIAEVGPSTVRIHLAFGEIGFSLEAVDRIVRAESSLIAYQSRRDELRASPSATAADWVELARWALAQGHGHGAREAALQAAEKNPRAEGLEQLMRGLNYVFEPQLDRWISFEESMVLKGFHQIDGQWLSAEQMLARSQAAAEAARAREAAQEGRLTRAVLALAAAQLAREPERRLPEEVYAWPVVVYPNPFIRRYPNPHRLGPPGFDPTAIPLARRQPGSLFSVAKNHGGFATTSTESGRSH